MKFSPCFPSDTGLQAKDRKLDVQSSSQSRTQDDEMYRLYSVWLRTNNAAHFGLYAIIIARTMKVRPKLRLTAITPQICESEFEADLFVSQSKVMHGYMLRFAGLMSGVSKQVTIEMTDRERGTQTNTNIPTD